MIGVFGDRDLGGWKGSLGMVYHGDTVDSYMLGAEVAGNVDKLIIIEMVSALWTFIKGVSRGSKMLMYTNKYARQSSARFSAYNLLPCTNKRHPQVKINTRYLRSLVLQQPRGSIFVVQCVCEWSWLAIDRKIWPICFFCNPMIEIRA